MKDEIKKVITIYTNLPFKVMVSNLLQQNQNVIPQYEAAVDLPHPLHLPHLLQHQKQSLQAL